MGSATNHWYRGQALRELGCHEEALEDLHAAEALAEEDRQQALTQEAIGLTLMELGQYSEAIGRFQQSIGICPVRGCSRRALAEVLLREGGREQDALAHAKLAVQTDDVAPSALPELHNRNIGEAVATLAWAMAVNGAARADIEPLIEEAERLCGRYPASSAAQVLYHTGLACQAIGLEAEAMIQFEDAIKVDPHGNFGRLARNAMPAARHA